MAKQLQSGGGWAAIRYTLRKAREAGGIVPFVKRMQSHNACKTCAVGMGGMRNESGTIRTEGRTLNVGRRAATAEARITDASGRLLAHATTTCLVFEIPNGT